MNASDLKGRAVMARGDATELAHIDDVLFDGQLQRVVGFRVKRGILAGAEALPRDAVATLDQDTVTITSPDAIVAEGRIPGAQGAVTFETARKTRVSSESGTVLGTLNDVEVDDEARTVLAYLITSSLVDKLLKSVPRIEASEPLHIGAGEIIVVPDEVAENPGT